MNKTLVEFAPDFVGYTSEKLWNVGKRVGCPNVRYLRGSEEVFVTRLQHPCRECPPWMNGCHRYRKWGLPRRTVLLRDEAAEAGGEL